MRRALTLLILSGAVVMLVVAPVTGHIRKFDNNVFVTFAAGGNYRGKVISGHSACERNRVVKVFHDSQPLFRIGKTTTAADGTWELRNAPKPPIGDKVFAVVTVRYFRRDDDHRHLCRRDQSPKVVYPKNG